MLTRFKHAMAIGALVVLGLATGQSARANVTNGGFEDSPDFNGWTTLGNTSIQGSDYHSVPQGSVQAVASTDVNPLPGPSGASTNIAGLEAFFGVAAGTFSGAGATSGSAIQQTFNANAGDSLSFLVNFLSPEGAAGNQDFLYATLAGPGGFFATGIITASDAVNPIDPLVTSVLFVNESGVVPGGAFLNTAGAYTLTIGAFNVNDLNNNSAALVDAVDVSAVPLPSTVLGGMILLGGLGVVTTLRRKAVIA